MSNKPSYNNYKLQLFSYALLCILFIGCKPAAQVFTYEKNIHFDFFKNITGILGDKNARIDSVKVYRAVLDEKLVERDNVTEYKLINTESQQETVDYTVNKNHTNLYLMQLFTTPDQDGLCVYLSSGYDPNNACTHLGPAYLGKIRMYKIVVQRELKIKQKKEQFTLTDMGRRKMNILLYNDFPDATDDTTGVGIHQFILLDNNKIGGNKPTLFTVEKIFNDSSALAFKYFETIKR